MGYNSHISKEVNMRIGKWARIVLLVLGLLLLAFSASAAGKKLVFWWWGEQEFAGLTGWLNDTIAIYEKEHPDVKVETTLQATENVFSDFPTASAAGNPPDLQYAWNGVYCMDWAWLGYLEP